MMYHTRCGQAVLKFSHLTPLPLEVSTKRTLHFISLLPGLHTAFSCTKEREREGPGMFPHVRDVEGRKVVERGQSGAPNSKKS